MSDLEFNKIFAGVLVAGILAMGGGFIAKIAVHPEHLEENAYKIEVTDTGAAVAAGPVGPESVLALLADADIEKGQKIAKKCAACHGFDKGGANKTGPNLYGIVNAPKAHHEGFSYSDALKAAGGNWDYVALNHWLWDPKDMVPGTKMNFAGLSKPSDRADLIAYMRSQSDNPAALPTAAEIAADMPEEAAAEDSGAEDGGAEEMQDVAPEAGDVMDGMEEGLLTDDTASEAEAQIAEDMQTITPEAGVEDAAETAIDAAASVLEEQAAPVADVAADVAVGAAPAGETVDAVKDVLPE